MAYCDDKVVMSVRKSSECSKGGGKRKGGGTGKGKGKRKDKGGGIEEGNGLGGPVLGG